MNYIFIYAPSRYGRKCEGHSYMEKRINMTFHNSIQMVLKIREIELFTRARPGSSLVHT